MKNQLFRNIPDLKITLELLSFFGLNSLKDVRIEYDAQQKEYTRFLKVLLLVNNMNTGNLCSICISQTVTSYYNPCGHTTCDECKRRLIEYAGETSITGCRCPICRVDIRGSEKIYFN